MKPQTITTRRGTAIRIDPKLDVHSEQSLFPEKLARANSSLRRHPLPPGFVTPPPVEPLRKKPFEVDREGQLVFAGTKVRIESLFASLRAGDSVSDYLQKNGDVPTAFVEWALALVQFDSETKCKD